MSTEAPITPTTTPPRIVVGVDGSGPSKRALAWAYEQARLTGAELHAVIAWSLPVYYGFSAVVDDFDVAAWSRDVLEQTVKEVLGDAPDVQLHVVEGHPATALVDLARGARMVVVGCRGHGAVAGALLGSVSRYVTGHAPCPVVVMRASDSPPHAA